MIGVLPDLPPNVAGFRASGDVTKDDFEKVLSPEVRKHMAFSEKLNFVFYVDTPLKNFSTGAWVRDIWLGIIQFASWGKIAIISDVEKIRNFTDNISFLLPGEYKGFPVAQLQNAIRWASAEEEETHEQVPPHIVPLLPPQVKGKSTMTSAQVTASKEADARFIFERATGRLLDVNEWTDHCGALSAAFQLTEPDHVDRAVRLVEHHDGRVQVDGLGLRAEAEETAGLRDVPAEAHRHAGQGAAGFLLQRDLLALLQIDCHFVTPLICQRPGACIHALNVARLREQT